MRLGDMPQPWGFSPGSKLFQDAAQIHHHGLDPFLAESGRQGFLRIGSLRFCRPSSPEHAVAGGPLVFEGDEPQPPVRTQDGLEFPDAVLPAGQHQSKGVDPFFSDARLFKMGPPLPGQRIGCGRRDRHGRRLWIGRGNRMFGSGGGRRGNLDMRFFFGSFHRRGSADGRGGSRRGGIGARFFHRRGRGRSGRSAGRLSGGGRRFRWRPDYFFFPRSSSLRDSERNWRIWIRAFA
jgi:hypothetical protein